MSLPALLGWTLRFLIVVGGAFLIDHFLPPQQWSWRIHDLIYRRLPPSPPDTQIVIVDIAHMGRADLTRLLHRIAEAPPRFIGIDAVFPELYASPVDTPWAQMLCSVATRLPLCLASTLDLSRPLTEAPKRPASHPYFTQCAEQAFANLVLYDTAARIVRECLLYTVASGDTALSLAARTALAMDSTLRDTLFMLPPRLPLRYRGGLTHFYLLSGEEILRDSTPLQWLQDKVCLLGVADPLRLTMEDIFFSPLNEAFLRRSLPDMYGVVIHANIAAMLAGRSFFTCVSPLWMVPLIFLGYLLITAVGMILQPGLWRGLLLRAVQIALLWGAVELTLGLGSRGYWLPVEPLLWGIVVAGELEIWRLPRRRRLA